MVKEQEVSETFILLHDPLTSLAALRPCRYFFAFLASSFSGEIDPILQGDEDDGSARTIDILLFTMMIDSETGNTTSLAT